MQLSIFAITFPLAPPGICTENLSQILGFCILIFPPGEGDYLVGPEGLEFVCIQFLPFLEFSLQPQELEIDNTLRIICCSESFYAFKENYSNLG